jgi:hypothetical protein
MFGELTHHISPLPQAAPTKAMQENERLFTFTAGPNMEVSGIETQPMGD